MKKHLESRRWPESSAGGPGYSRVNGDDGDDAIMSLPGHVELKKRSAAVAAAALAALVLLFYLTRGGGTLRSPPSSSSQPAAGPLALSKFLSWCDGGEPKIPEFRIIGGGDPATCRQVLRGVGDLLRLLSNPKDASCSPRRLLQVLELESGVGEVDLGDSSSSPSAMASKVEGWLGGAVEKVKQVLKQPILQVRNPFAGTSTAFNPLRASRPLPVPKLDPAAFLSSFMNRTGGEKCDFCHYEDRTAADIFGRLESSLAATAANVFKVRPAHSLVFPKRHDAAGVTLEELQECFELARRWAEAQRRQDADRTHLHLIYDSLEHAGASQAHPHLHMLMGEGNYLGQFRALHDAHFSYSKLNGGCGGGSSSPAAAQQVSSYLSDFVRAHLDVGLGVELEGGVAVISPLDARKDHELMVISSTASPSWVRAVHATYRAYVERLGVLCWSGGFAIQGGDLPAMARIGSRGNCQSLMSDASSFELYMIYNVNTNPYSTIEAYAEQARELGLLKA